MEPNSEVEQKPSPLAEKLKKVAVPLQAIINESLMIDRKDPLNIHAGVNARGRFAFWAGLEPKGFHADLPVEPTAVIKNLRVPEYLRGRGLGSRIVKVWEDELSKEGINVFAATNIKDPAAIEFWKRLGYQIPKSDYKAIPYYMYKQLTNEPKEPQAVPEPKLTSEQVARADKDIKTLSSLTEFAKAKGLGFELSGGYAVEALCGGNITRPHGDVDVSILLPAGYDRSQIPPQIEVLLAQDPTRWKVRTSNNHLLELIEDKDGSFFDKRRLELYFYNFNPETSRSQKILIDSKGNRHEITVVSLPRLVSDRIRVLVEHSRFSEYDRAKKGARPTRETDFEDLKRLITHGDFKKEDYLKEAISYYTYVRELNQEDALKQAEENWSKAMRLIQV